MNAPRLIAPLDGPRQRRQLVAMGKPRYLFVGGNSRFLHFACTQGTGDRANAWQGSADEAARVKRHFPLAAGFELVRADQIHAFWKAGGR
jgi:hypothetical protein